MNDVIIRATAVWTAEHGAPSAELLPAAQRRRCSLATRIVAEVTGAIVAKGLVLERAAIVHGTAFGEIATTAALLDMMREGAGELSPLRFAGSVHNTATGQLAIACDHTGVTSTISAGHHTVASAWIEALALLATGTNDVLVVVADEAMPAVLRPNHDGLAVALWLSMQGDGPVAGVARWLGAQRDTPAAARVPAPLHDNPVRFAWSIANAVGTDARIRLEPDDARGHSASIELRSGAR